MSDPCQQLIDTMRGYAAAGLGVGTSGNASVRTADGFVITPSGLDYDQLRADSLVFCDLQGKVTKGQLAPSSEWRFHAAIYGQRKSVAAVVHAHAPYSTALSCVREPIPPFHYMVAVAGGKDIPCAEYATFGTRQLADNVTHALRDRKACLLANHGLVATGGDLRQAFRLAQEVENLARQYCLAKQYGSAVLLSDEEMRKNLEKFADYGVPRSD